MSAKAPVYLDTSAYLAILLGDSRAKNLVKFVRNKELCSSALMLVEAERNLVRMSREKKLSMQDFEIVGAKLREAGDVFLLRDVTTDLCLNGVYPPVRIPRSGDLVHLRTALWFQDNGGLTAFLTFDDAQRAAARELRLPVG